MSYSPEYNRAYRKRNPERFAWRAMVSRCTNKKDIYYRLYGGRGITVCDRWRESYENFIADMGKRPTPKHTLDRIDNDGDYEPGNCRWVTRDVQNHNKRNVRMITAFGKTMCLAEWARETGIKESALFYRLQAWPSVEDAVSIPVKARAKP